jgi:hypothetical protein
LEHLAQSSNQLSAVMLGWQKELIDVIEPHPSGNMTEPLQ